VYRHFSHLLRLGKEGELRAVQEQVKLVLGEGQQDIAEYMAYLPLFFQVDLFCFQGYCELYLFSLFQAHPFDEILDAQQ